MLEFSKIECGKRTTKNDSLFEISINYTQRNELWYLMKWSRQTLNSCSNRMKNSIIIIEPFRNLFIGKKILKK